MSHEPRRRLFRACALIVHPSLWLTLLAVALIVLGCSAPTKDKWLRTFFDGVPVAGAVTNQAAAQFDEDGRPLAAVATAAPTNLLAAIAPPFTKHPPYDEKKCSECHISKFSVAMKAPQKEVCFACHKDFLATMKAKHQPVDNGECTSCHEP